MADRQYLMRLTVLACSVWVAHGAWAVEADHHTAEATEPKTLPKVTVKATRASAEPRDISAVAKTVVTREEMLKYGDQSVSDTLRRAAGFQMPVMGQGPRGGGGAAGARFRGGAGPVFLINGEPVQGGPRGGMSLIDTLTPDMIERIEITKQPSVTQSSVASAGVINIILKEPIKDQIGGTVRAGYGTQGSNDEQEDRTHLSLQMDGRDDALSYSLSAHRGWEDTSSISRTITNNIEQVQHRQLERTMMMVAPRVQYELDKNQKLIAEMFYREHQMDGQRDGQLQEDQNDSLRLNTRYERRDGDHTDKVRVSVEQQHESQLTRSTALTQYTDEQINEYGVAYDGLRKIDSARQVKFGIDLRHSELDSNVSTSLDEQRQAMYLEGSWRFSDTQTVTLGARQEWLQRSGLVDYNDQHFSPVLAHRYEFDDRWSIQTNLSQAFRSPQTDRLIANVSISTDSDAGTLNNPDRGGNPNLKPEQIQAIESTLGYNSPFGGFNLTAYQREISDYIERVVMLEDGRYVERPQNQAKANTYGVELSGRYALKQTETGHSLMVNAQLSTVRAKIELAQQAERLASDVAPYSASAGMSYNYQPWQLAASLNVSYTPEFTRPLDDQPYDRTLNERVSVDVSVTKRLVDGWGVTLSGRNLLSTDYQETLTQQSNGALYQSRNNQAIPSVLLSVEKKF
jgi:outer membrane receptor for ferrienterochelin and colicins